MKKLNASAANPGFGLGSRAAALFVGVGLWLAISARAAAGEPAAGVELRFDARMHAGAILSTAMDLSGQIVATAGEDRTVRLWNLHQHELERTYYLAASTKTPAQVRQLAFSPSGRQLAVFAQLAGREPVGQIYLLELRQGGALVPVGPAKASVIALGFAGDGTQLWWVGTNGAYLQLPGVRAPHYLPLGCPDGGAVKSAVLGARGQLLVLCQQGTLYSYVLDGKELRQRASAQPPAGAYRVWLSPDGAQLAVGLLEPPRIELRSTADLQLQRQLAVGDLELDDGSQLGWSGSGQELMLAARKGQRATLRRFLSDGGLGEVSLRDEQVTALLTVKPASLPPPVRAWVLNRDFTALDKPVAGSLLAATGGSGLWLVPPHGAAVPLRPRQLAQPVRDRLDVDSSGGRVQLLLAGGQRIQLSLLEHRIRMVASADSSVSAPRHTFPGGTVEQLDDTGSLLLNKKPLPLAGRVRCWSFAADGSGLVVAAAETVQWFSNSGVASWQHPLDGEPQAINVAGDGKVVVISFADGRLTWLSAADGRVLLHAALLSDAVAWAAWSESGYYDGSADGEKFLVALLRSGGESGLRSSFRANLLQDSLRRPDVIERIVFTRDEATAIADANAASGIKGPSLPAVLPPILAVESPEEQVEATSAELRLRVRVRLPGGQPLRALRVRINGAAGRVHKLVIDRPVALPAEQQPADAALYELKVELPPEDCAVLVQAQTALAESEPAIVRVRWRGAAGPLAPTLPNLYVLAAGVSRYKEAPLRLEYPAKDARDLVTTLKIQQGRLYSQVVPTLLVDQEVTKPRIIEEFGKLRRAATGDDVVVVFLAGHGVSNGPAQRYYFYPFDADPIDLPGSALSASELRVEVGALPGKVVLLLDTCHAGGSLDQRAALREGDLQRVASQLSTTESNIIVFAASTGPQTAQESAAWGNGAFTKALVEGLRGKADFTASGLVSVSQLEAYVSSRVRTLTREQQTPTTTKPNAIIDFSLARVPLPLYRRWWLWGSIGLATAAIVTGAVVAAAPWREPLPVVALP